jgi:hypothetical protein
MPIRATKGTPASRWSVLFGVLACGCSSSSSHASSMTTGDGGSSGASGTASSGTTGSSGSTGSSGTTSGGAASSSGTTSSGGSSGGVVGPLNTCSNAAATIPDNSSSGLAPGVISGMVSGPGTFIDGCQIFPANNAWNVDISSGSLPTTTAYSGIPQSTTLHPDLGGWTSSGPYGIPYNAVPNGQPLAAISFTQYASESDPGPDGWTSRVAPTGDKGSTSYPIPDSPKIEGAPAAGKTHGDDHLLVLQQGAACTDACTLWETWDTVGGTTPPWSAANGASWDLASNKLRPPGWTSGDAAGLSVFAGVLKISEVLAGVVTHAIRVTFNSVQYGYVAPASHCVGTMGATTSPPMGLRLRLQASVDTSGFTGPGKIVATAMKTYGLIVADIGTDWYFQGDSDNRWDDNDPNGSDTYVGELITDFGNVSGANFEVIDTGSVSTDGC